jgi:outer membrane lipoprotein LolB
MRANGYRMLFLSLLLLAQAGCALLDPQSQPVSTNWKAHRQQLSLLEQWTASGKLALRTADAAESASLVWQQQGAETDLRLSGPLGIGTTLIHSDGRQLDIRRGDEHHTLDISTPEAIAHSTGWDLPLPALAHWLKGLPSPDSRVQELAIDPQTGLLKNLQQDGWEISYNRYKPFQGFTLPTHLKIKRGATEAKIIIAQWRTTAN